MQNDAISNAIQILEYVREAGGIELKSRHEQVRYLADILGINLQSLACGIIFENPEITAVELAEKLGVSRQRVYLCPNVSRTLRARRARDYDLAVKSDEVADYRGRNER